MTLAVPPYRAFSISIVPHRDDVTVVPVGELDLTTVDAVAEAVGDLRTSGFRDIAVDLRGVDFMDSMALRMLLALREQAEGGEGALLLIPPKPAVARIFDLTGTRDLFDWRDRFPA